MATLAVGIDSSQAKAGSQQYKKSVEEMINASLKAEKQQDELQKELDQTGKQAGKTAGSIKRLAVGFSGLLAARAAIRIIADFEERLAELQGVTGASIQTMEQLEDTVRKLGATTRFSASQAAEGLTFLARAGFAAEDAMAALPATLNLATVASIDLGQAADFASNLVSQFGLDAKETARVVDVLTVASNNANTNVTQLAEAMKFVGPVAQAVGLSVEETAAAIGALGNAGIQASLAGTNLRGIIARLIKPSGQAASALKRLGVETKNADGTMRNLRDIFVDLRAANLNASDALEIFGRLNVSAAIALSEQTDALDELIAKTNDAEGASQEFADTMNDTLVGAFLSLKSAIEEIVLATGDAGIAGALKSVLLTITDVIRVFGGMSDTLGENKLQAQILAGAITSLGVAFVGLKLAAVVQSLASVTKGLTGASRAMAALNVAARANPFLLIAGAATALIGVFSALRNDTKGLKDDLDSLTDGQSDFARAVQALADAQEDAARAEFNEQLLTQQNAINNQISALEDLRFEMDRFADAGGNVIDVSTTLNQVIDDNVTQTETLSTAWGKLIEDQGLLVETAQTTSEAINGIVTEQTITTFTTASQTLEALDERIAALKQEAAGLGDALALPEGVGGTVDLLGIGIESGAIEEGIDQQVADQLSKRLAAIESAFETEREVLEAQNAERLAFLEDSLLAKVTQQPNIDDLLIKQKEFFESEITRIEREEADARRKLLAKDVSFRISQTAAGLSTIQNLIVAFGNSALAENKGFAIANAVINTAQGITKTIGELGFPAAIPFVAAAAAAGAAQIATITGASKGSGGSVSAGAGAVGAPTAPTASTAPPAEVVQDANKLDLSISVEGIEDGQVFQGSTVIGLIEQMQEKFNDGVNGGGFTNIGVAS